MKIIDNLLKGFGISENKDEKIVMNVNENIKKTEQINVNDLVVFAPKNMEELNRVIDCVVLGQSIIVDMASFKKNEFIRVLDYVNGALYAVKGSINCLQNSLYILTPKNINLSTL